MSFNIPVVLFLFKRKEASLQIIEKIRRVGVNKLYLMSDQGRSDDEREKVKETREAIELAIDWKCEVIKNYAETNRGVFGNIAFGAKWVFEREKWAIFLEDDNLPEESFFPYCEELLKKYEKDNRILWICGTNYLGKYRPENNVSYMFTKHMLPCGWASWSDKFIEYYDETAKVLDDPWVEKRFLDDFPTKKMSDVYIEPLRRYRKTLLNGEKPPSWDYQMCLSIRTNNMFGISPINNQIKNIGVDENSEHGGNTMMKIMTRRFCGMDSYPLETPLKHPVVVMSDLVYEHMIDKVVTPPIIIRLKHHVAKRIKKIFGLNKDEPFFRRVKK